MGPGPGPVRALVWLGQRASDQLCLPREAALRGAVEDSTAPSRDARADLLVVGPAGTRGAEAHEFASSRSHSDLGRLCHLLRSTRGGIETSFKGDKQGLGLTTRNKKRFEAQHMLVLPGSLAHNVVVWARRWLSCPQIHHYGILRLVRDVFHVSGLLRFDASGSVVEIVLNQQACLARSFIRPLQTLLAPLHIVVNLGET